MGKRRLQDAFEKPKANGNYKPRLIAPDEFPDDQRGDSWEGGTSGATEPGDGESDAWEDLILRPPIPPAPFPLDALPRSMRDYAEQVAKALPCPVDMVAVAALGAAAAAIGNSRHLRIKSTWTEGPRLWLAIVCGPGTMKSPALAAATRPTRDAQRQKKREYDKDLKAYKEQEKDRKKQKEAGQAAEEGEAGEPKMGQVFTGDTTREGLAHLLEDNPRGLALIRDELTGWALSLNQYKSGKGDDRQFWLSLWSGGEILVNRASSRGKPAAYVTNPMLSIIGCLPPSVLRQLQDEQSREDGFVHRILFSWPTEVDAVFSKLEPDPETVKSFTDLVGSLFGLEMTTDKDIGESVPLLLKLTQKAETVFAGFINGLAAEVRENAFPDNLRGPWAKLRGYGARLALILHVCRFVSAETSTPNVDEVSMRNAVELIDYFKAHARRVYPFLQNETDILKEKDIQAMLDWIKRGGKACFTWNECYRDLGQRFESAEGLRVVLGTLEERGCIRERHQERRGASGRKPKPAYEVHPSLLHPTKPTKPTK